MKRSHAHFKRALRYCRHNEDLVRADACASSLADKDFDKFWKRVNKISNNKSTIFATSVGGSIQMVRT